MPPQFTESLLAAAIGLVVGSFLATLALRLPKRQPIVFARSACPHCGHKLLPAELIPLLSWIAQRGRCRACGARISAFYPLMEIAAAAVAVSATWWTSGTVLIVTCLLGWFLLVVVAWAWCSSRLKAGL